MPTIPRLLWQIGLWWTLFILMVLGVMAAGFDAADFESQRLSLVVVGGLSLMAAGFAIQILKDTWEKLDGEFT